jgi:hypothetical protein
LSPSPNTRAVSVHNRLVTLPDSLPTLTLGWEAVRWATKYLRHPNGPRAGQRWQFVDSQVRFLLHWYAVDETGVWLYRHGARRLAKGSGKSPFAALLSLVELCAPVRLADFDSTAPGGCIGRPVDMPLVQIAATAESQTANTMRMVRAFASKGSRVVVEHGLDVGKTVFYKPGGGQLQTITSSATAAEGAEVTFVVADETEHWTPGNGGLELSQTLDRNLRKSGSRMMETSNAWEPGVGSVAEATWDGFVAQEEGRTKGATRILYDARVAPPGTDLADEASLTAALEHVYGDCFWVNLADIREAIWDVRTPVDISRRFYLNQPTAALDAWVTPQQWAACARVGETVEPGEDIVAFFDGSKSRDATALIGCRVSDGFVFTIGVWEPGTDEVVDALQVDGAVAWMFETYNVVGFYADVREWESFTKVSWPEQYTDGLAVWAESRGTKDPQPIAWDMRNHVLEFTKAAELAAAEIADGALPHDGDSRVARHVGNARRRVNRWGVSIGKETRDSPHKIDAAVCVIGARMVRRYVLAQDYKAKPKRPRTGRVAAF